MPSGLESKDSKPSGYDAKTPYYRPTSGAQKAEGVKLPLDRDKDDEPAEDGKKTESAASAGKPVTEPVVKKKHPGFIWSHFVRPPKPAEEDTAAGSSEATEDRKSTGEKTA